MLEQRSFIQILFFEGEDVSFIEKGGILPNYKVRKILSHGFKGFLAKHKKTGEFRYFIDLVKIEIFHLKLEEVKKITAEYLQVSA